MTDCPRFNKLLGACNFEGRYDKSAADPSVFQSIEGHGFAAILEKMRTVTYVRDVCVRCGKTIERKP